MARLSPAKRRLARTRRQNSLLHARLEAMQRLAVRYYQEAHPIDRSEAIDPPITDSPQPIEPFDLDHVNSEGV